MQFGNESCDPGPPENFTKFNDTGDIIGNYSCIDFDEFIGGTLDCTDTCEFNDSGCNFYPGDGSEFVVGNCTRSSEVISECDEGGFYTIQWTGNWQWGAGNTGWTEAECLASTPCDNIGECVNVSGTYYCDKSGSRAKCIAEGTNVIECPAQIRLPFFGNLQILITLLVIALIYGMLRINKKMIKSNTNAH